ncbi:MAG: hypothetical protein ACI4PQ_08935, partial [Butyricicoccaceae bacterium]
MSTATPPCVSLSGITKTGQTQRFLFRLFHAQQWFKTGTHVCAFRRSIELASGVSSFPNRPIVGHTPPKLPAFQQQSPVSSLTRFFTSASIYYHSALSMSTKIFTIFTFFSVLFCILCLFLSDHTPECRQKTARPQRGGRYRYV